MFSLKNEWKQQRKHALYREVKHTVTYYYYVQHVLCMFVLVLTEFTVAEVLRLVLVLPAFAQTHCIMGEIRLWRRNMERWWAQRRDSTSHHKTISHFECTSISWFPQSQMKAGQALNHNIIKDLRILLSPDLDLSLSWKANLNHSKVVDN